MKDVIEIERSFLTDVNGGDMLNKFADAIGPTAAKYYGEDWNSASCTSRANLAAGGVRNLTVLAAGAVGLGVGKLTHSAKAGTIAAFGSDIALDWTRTKMNSHYLSKVCGK